VRVAAAGDTAYVVDVDGGLRVVAVDDPSRPVEVGSIDLDGIDVVVSGATAYVTSPHGLWIVDVRDPAHPAQAGFYPLENTFFAEIPDQVVVSGEFAYIASNGLRVLDVSDPAHPQEAAWLEFSFPVASLAITGSHVYLTGYSAGLFVIDVSVPDGPFVAGFFKTPDSAWGVSSSVDVVAVAARYGGLFFLRDLAP
jgi:hypothetical protein